ncbi:MAG: hypothetical protein N4A48_06365 [Tepidibacter sp.]|jgi:hypothetical protein|uniref:hypothetical protein n=1 Tax=Tepidibacter sp. TaxID=2529387 RepID=UPI0025E2ED76|nr:hypothetical protein [Tepidibacter sp.]MCT4508374.1 hypothetical protein [Tepidibacter sp.]
MANSVTLPPVPPATGGYTIAFISAVCNPDGTQTWTYETSITGVPPTSGSEISNFVFRLCSDPRHEVISYSQPDGVGPVETGSFISCFDFPPGPPDPTINAIKWDGVNNNNFSGTYTFTLSDCFEQTDISVAVKTGGGSASPTTCLYGLITGPSCLPLQTQKPSRGTPFSKEEKITAIY